MNTVATFSEPGSVVSVRGGIVDIRFENRVPPIHSLLRAGKEGEIVIEVLSQLDMHNVRGIALTPTQGLARAHAGHGYAGAAAGAGRQYNALAHVRCILAMPSTGCLRRQMCNGVPSTILSPPLARRSTQI